VQRYDFFLNYGFSWLFFFELWIFLAYDGPKGDVFSVAEVQGEGKTGVDIGAWGKDEERLGRLRMGC